MDTIELKKEQLKLARRINLQDGFTKIKTIGGVECLAVDNKLVAAVVVCEFPSFKIIEKRTYTMPNSLPFKPGYLAYRDMPAIMEAFNQLEEEPDLLIVKGNGILHQRRFGLASHLGLALNKPTIGISLKLSLGQVENGKVIYNGDILGFEIKTREYANPIYVSPGHLVSLGGALNLIPQTIKHPHKIPEPQHLDKPNSKCQRP